MTPRRFFLGAKRGFAMTTHAKTPQRLLERCEALQATVTALRRELARAQRENGQLLVRLAAVDAERAVVSDQYERLRQLARDQWPRLTHAATKKEANQ